MVVTPSIRILTRDIFSAPSSDIIFDKQFYNFTLRHVIIKFFTYTIIKRDISNGIVVLTFSINIIFNSIGFSEWY